MGPWFWLAAAVSASVFLAAVAAAVLLRERFSRLPGRIARFIASGEPKNVESVFSFLKWFLSVFVVGLSAWLINHDIQKQEHQARIRTIEGEYLKTFLSEALTEDLVRRKKFAQYFATMTLEPESRRRWHDYLGLIESEIKAKESRIGKSSDDYLKLMDTLNDLQNEIERTRLASGPDKDPRVQGRLDSLSTKYRALLHRLTQLKADIANLQTDISPLDKAIFEFLVPSEYVGTWKGTGSQTNGEKWDIILSIHPTQARVKYPSLSCEGLLGSIENGNDSLVLRENITTGLGKCINYGSMVLRLSNDTLHYKWYYPSGEFGASGLLFK